MARDKKFPRLSDEELQNVRKVWNEKVDVTGLLLHDGTSFSRASTQGGIWMTRLELITELRGALIRMETAKQSVSEIVGALNATVTIGEEDDDG